MITMEDSVAALLEQDVIDKDEARKALLKASDEGDEHEEGEISAALGGGRTDNDTLDMNDSSGKSGDGESDGEYSF